jgi:protease-4
MKKCALIISIFLFAVTFGFGQNHKFVSYYELNDFLQASPGAFKYGLYGFSNPAATTYLNGSDILFTYSQRNEFLNKWDNRWGLFIANPQETFFTSKMPSSGLGVMRDADSTKSVYDVRYSWGFGNKKFNFGYGIGLSFGDVSHFNRAGLVYFGGIYRPFRQLSVGLQRTFAFQGDGETVAEIAIRPIGSYPLAFYADVAMFDDIKKINDANWSAGISWEVIDGFRLNSRYFKDKSLAVGIDISLGNFGITSQSHFNNEQKFGYNSYSIRVGALDRTYIDNVEPGNNYMSLDLKGQINYLGFLWFDNSNKLLDLLEKIDAATKDNSIKGLVINTSGMAANMELKWEIREKLREFKESGKTIVMFADRLGISDYHFVSIADRIVLDQIGGISLEGFALGRSYHKKLLEKAGIGFQELRFFKYKSAYENFERDDMSEADREQRQKLVDDWYEITRKEICDSRGFSEDEFDKLVDENFLYTAPDAIAKKLVDTLGRWSDAKDILKNMDKKARIKTSVLVFKQNPPYDDKWGEPARSIAVVYALGACAMDEGIKARSLSAYLKKLAQSNVGAIVLRVDSPGGDGMASDLVAEVIREFKGKKPIIISQGAVAASGGYWLSMDADTIVAAPMTITGSIGVIAGWFYNDGLADSLGIKTEVVKRGKYADLGYPFTLPLIPIGLPNRNLTENERQQFENYIRGHYKDFVTMVSNGRGMSYDSVHDVAQGRVWTGLTGKKIGLVDEIGGLDLAIKIAKEKAGYSVNDEVKIFQYPSAELFDLFALLSGGLGIDLKSAKNQFNALKFRMDNNGIPMPMMPLDYLEYVQEK